MSFSRRNPDASFYHPRGYTTGMELIAADLGPELKRKGQIVQVARCSGVISCGDRAAAIAVNESPEDAAAALKAARFCAPVIGATIAIHFRSLNKK